MRISRLTILTTAILIFAGCKKEKTGSVSDVDNCTITRTLRDGDVIPGQYIVSYKQGIETTAAASTQIARKSRNVLQENNISATSLESSFTGDLSGFVAHLSENEAQRLAADPAVERVEPDRFIALSTCFTVVAPTLITWNINKVGYGNGIGKTAWIVDTGIDFDHPDLTVDVARSKSFISGQTSADDENGHGTHVAGIIGAKNNTIGVLGVASGATLVSLRVLDKDGTGSLSSIIEALSYVNANAKAGDVVNMSVGEDQVSDILDQQVKVTAAKGIFITIAAGNDSKSASLFSPGRANATNIYTVSAVDSLDNFANFSNYGNDVVDYAAPGVRILSTYKDGLYAKMSGTSMAAPHVAGLLLLDGKALHYSTTAKNDPDGTPDLIVLK